MFWCLGCNSPVKDQCIVNISGKMLKCYEKKTKKWPGLAKIKRFYKKIVLLTGEWQHHNPIYVIFFYFQCDISLISYISKGLLSRFCKFSLLSVSI